MAPKNDSSSVEAAVESQETAESMTQNADPHVQQTASSSSQIIQDNECWGRLMPTLPGPQACGYDFMIDQQVYTLGRSLDCDIVATEPPKDHARAQWAYAMISNQHCRVYYGKDRTGSHRECAFLQDCSGNGTMINRRLLRKGESRRLHSGDEICLVNPDTLRKKVRSQSALAELTSRYSYVFAETNPTPTTQPESQSTEILTQNPDFDLTQLGDEDDAAFPLSPLPPFSPPRPAPWGRLMPTVAGREPVDLLAKPPQKPSATGGISLLGLQHLQPSDIFNEHSVGRSQQCDVKVVKCRGANKLQDWAFGMISNRHCKIYCTLENLMMQVVLEDCSGNGTLINQTALLRRGEKRVLHSGDEICLINPRTLEKKVRSSSTIQGLLQEQSFVFINLQQQQRPSLLSKALVPASTGKRKAAVNPREMRSHSILGAASSVTNLSPSAGRRRRVEEDYDIRDILGSGTVGQVRRAIHRQTGKERAVKIIGGGRNRFMAGQQQDPLEVEAAILRELQHPYVVQLIDVYISSKNNTVYLVMELLNGGDLFDRIVEKTMYTEVESRRVMRRLLNAIHYLHEDCNIVHRDIKPENILLCSKTNCIDVKLTDFGLAKEVKGNDLKTFCGTPQYFAPEVLKRQSTVAGRGRYGKPADMWSLGVVLYVMLSGMPPFDDDSHGKLEFPEDPWQGISQEAQDLIQRLLQADPRKRCTVKQACEHPWILTEDFDTHIHPLRDPAVSASIKPKDSTQRTASNEAMVTSAKTDKRVSTCVNTRKEAPEIGYAEAKLTEEIEHVPKNELKCSPKEDQCSLSEVPSGNSEGKVTQHGPAVSPLDTSSSKTESKNSRNEDNRDPQPGNALSSSPLVSSTVANDENRPASPRRPLSPVQLNSSPACTTTQTPRNSTSEKDGEPEQIATSFAPPDSHPSVRFSSAPSESFTPIMQPGLTSFDRSACRRPARVSDAASLLAAAQRDSQSDDDEILSSFSEKTDSIDSFASTSGEGSRSAEPNTEETTHEHNKQTKTGNPLRKRGGDSLASLFDERPAKKAKPGTPVTTTTKPGSSTRQTNLSAFLLKGG